MSRLVFITTPVAGVGRTEPGLGDAFLDEAFTLALQRVRQNRLLEAEHLLDVLQELAPNHPGVQCEAAKVQVLLGLPGALGEVQALDRIAAQVFGQQPGPA